MNYEWINYYVYDREIIISDSTAPSAGYSDDEQVNWRTIHSSYVDQNIHSKAFPS